MKYKILQELISKLEIFENQAVNKENANVDDFLNWLNNQNRENPLDYQAPPIEDEAEAVPLQGGTQAQLSQLLVLMNKYVRYYLRKAFEGSPLASADEFGFLATLIFYGDMQKTELIQRNTSELTSGMEVIKRLEKLKLIRSFADPKDQRARRVAATDTGIEAFAAVMPQMQQIGQLAMGNLNENEQLSLFLLLNKLNDFHQPIFQKTKKDDWQGIANKFL